MFNQSINEDAALEIIDDLIKLPTIVPDNGMIIKFSNEATRKLLNSLRDFDNFRAMSLTNGAKRVII